MCGFVAMNKSRLVGALLLLVSIISSSCDSKPQPAPTEPAAAEQTPAEPAPAEQASPNQEQTEQAPADPAPAEQSANEVATSEQTPGEQAPTEQTATEQVPTEQPQAEQQPAEPAPPEESPATQAPLDDSVKDAKLEYMKLLQASMDAAVERKDMEKAKQFAREIQKVAAEISAAGNKTNEESPEPAESAEQNTVVAQSNEEETTSPAETPEPAATPEPAKTSDSNSLYEAEIARLVEQLNKEKAQAVAPIQKRFDLAAQQLLRKVTQSGNLEAAMKLKEVIEDPEELADFKNEAKTMQDKELVRLVDQRDKAAAVAAAPAERRFDLATQQLIRKATQTGDLDASIKLKDMITEAKNSAGSAPVEVAKTGSNSSSTSSKGKECPEKDFEVSTSGNGCAITKYVGNSKRVIIPASIENKPVVRISDKAFWENSKIEEVFLPDNLKLIDAGSFYGCSKLSKINIPPSVTAILQWAFQGTALKELNIPASVKIFNSQGRNFKMEKVNVDTASEHFTSVDGVLYDKQVTTLVHVPAGLKMKKLKVPKSVRKIAKRCMGGSQLQSIQIPKEAEIDEEAFVGAEKVEVIRY